MNLSEREPRATNTASPYPETQKATTTTTLTVTTPTSARTTLLSIFAKYVHNRFHTVYTG